MERLFELSRLLDFYGALLTKRQRTLMAQYANEDCSLAEIAEREGISRQAVRDALRHGEAQLRAYEDKLHLIDTSDKVQKACDALQVQMNDLPVLEEKKQRMLQCIASIRSAMEGNDGV